MSLRRFSFCAAAVVAVAAIVAPGGVARTDSRTTHVATFHCSQNFASYQHTLPVGGAFLFVVEHSFARVELRMLRRVASSSHDGSHFATVWGWAQPEHWIVGSYHVASRVAAYHSEYAVSITTASGSTGSCTVQVYVVH
jgi:hypothetical protein